MIEIQNVSKHFVSRDRDRVAALTNVSISIRRNEFVCLVGPSGCGKSTLLELIAGLQEPDGGSIAAAGATAPRERLRACAFMPQRDLLLPWRDALANAAASVVIHKLGTTGTASLAEISKLVVGDL